MSAQEVPAVIAGSVDLLKFSEALARAGLIGRHDAKRGFLVIEPVPERCRACGGSVLDEDAQCEFCEAPGTVAMAPQEAQERRPDARGDTGCGSALTRLVRPEWRQRPESTVTAADRRRS